eukprot:8969421-Pyramimonas_sp.AAC.1
MSEATGPWRAPPLLACQPKLAQLHSDGARPLARLVGSLHVRAAPRCASRCSVGAEVTAVWGRFDRRTHPT